MRHLLFIFCAMILLLPSLVWADQYSCGGGLSPCPTTPIQGVNRTNSQTTGAATTAVVVTLAAVPGVRHHLFSVEARCNTAAATSNLTITDGGTAVWSTTATEVIAATNFVRNWSPALTGGLGTAVVVTLAACTAGTGTLIVQTDRF